MKIKIKTKILNSFRSLFKNKFLETILRSLIQRGMFSKVVPNHYQYKPNTFRVINIRGINMNIDISDYVGHYLYFGFKDSSLDSLLNLVHQNMNIIDVGANIGFTVFSMASKCSPEGKIYAFEPDPYNFLQLKNNKALNSFNNIEIFNLGAGLKKEQLKLAVNTENNRGGNRIKQNVSENYSLVNIIKLDDFIVEKNIKKIDLIKIDVEGFEMNVLFGARQLLNQYMPVLFIELSDNNLREQGSDAAKLISFLIGLGYKCINANNNELVNSDDNFINCHYDIICTK